MRLLPTAALLTAAVAACGTGAEPGVATVPLRECGLTIWHKPASADARVEIVGDWNGWKRPGLTPDVHEDGWRVAAVSAGAGEHAYAIIEDGVWLTDKSQPMTGTYEGHEVTVASAADCGRPALRVDAVTASATGEATIEATFLSAQSGRKIDPRSLVATGRKGEGLQLVALDAEHGKLRLETSGLKRGKYTYTLEAADLAGVTADVARATVWIDGHAEPWDPRDAIVYQVVLDRFRNANGALDTPATPSARAGGNLAGVRRSLDEIQALGATAIWLSPLYKNPVGEFAGNDGRQYSSYHGYWPVDSRALDERFATEAELDAFMDDAHARGMRVLFDVVPNHVHEQHPLARAHADWFNKDCLCGQGSCDWGAHIKTCLFAPYLPDFDWNVPDVQRTVTDDVMWWFDRWDADGIRIDAVPMTPRSATRRIATAARKRYAHPGHALYVIGENFTGPGGYQSLRYDLGPYGLDGSFHFPLMWSMREAIAMETAPLSAIEESFRAGEKAWEGAGAVMGLMIGNHDVARFASISAGNADGDAWEAPPQPTDPIVYAKQRLALATVFTFPGAPVLYYGDEVGLAGRSDPDCRRVMPAEDALFDEQRATRELARKLGQARVASRALRRGDLRTLVADEERIVFARTTEEGETAIVALNRRPTRPNQVKLPPEVPRALVDVVTGENLDVDGLLPVTAEPFDIHVYLPRKTQP